jgi:hypothetical protein
VPIQGTADRSPAREAFALLVPLPVRTPSTVFSRARLPLPRARGSGGRAGAQSGKRARRVHVDLPHRTAAARLTAKAHGAVAEARKQLAAPAEHRNPPRVRTRPGPGQCSPVLDADRVPVLIATRLGTSPAPSSQMRDIAPDGTLKGWDQHLSRTVTWPDLNAKSGVAGERVR